MRLPDGARKPASLVATDHARMLVLLKIDADKPLAHLSRLPPAAKCAVGQWAIAVGRTFDSQHPNMAVGILSALDRVWGKAIQTDAAVSPNNYGGPLVDIRGRVLGVLVPLSPEGADEMAGVEWYDSGIGFAVPMEHVQRILPRLKKGEDLYPGVLGVSLKGPNLVYRRADHRRLPPEVPGRRWPASSPATGSSRSTAAPSPARPKFSEELGRRYAGDTMRMTVLRGKQRDFAGHRTGGQARTFPTWLSRHSSPADLTKRACASATCIPRVPRPRRASPPAT